MDEQKFTFSGSFKKIREYIDTQIELVKLKAIAKSSKLISRLILDATSLLIGVFIVFFFSLALGFFLGQLMSNIALGFLTTGALFLLILFIIKSRQSKIEEKVINKIIKGLLSIWDDDFDNPNSKSENKSNAGVADGEETSTNG